MAKKKISNPSTVTLDWASHPPIDNYMDIFTFREVPVSDVWLEGLAAELVKWAKEDPGAYKLNRFFSKKGFHHDDLVRWEERCPALKRAHEFALMEIGDRRELKGLERKWDPGMVLSSMPKYDKDWKALGEWRASLTKKDEATTATNTVVVIDKYPETSVVPVKVDEKV